jgi:hypothetical protein
MQIAVDCSEKFISDSPFLFPFRKIYLWRLYVTVRDKKVFLLTFSQRG